jgi:hypothetical protein
VGYSAAVPLRVLLGLMACATVTAVAGCGGGDGDVTAGTQTGATRIDRDSLIRVFRDLGLGQRASECAVPLLRIQSSPAAIARAFQNGQDALMRKIAIAAAPCDRRYPTPSTEHHASLKRLSKLVHDPARLRQLLRRRQEALEQHHRMVLRVQRHPYPPTPPGRDCGELRFGDKSPPVGAGPIKAKQIDCASAVDLVQKAHDRTECTHEPCHVSGFSCDIVDVATQTLLVNCKAGPQRVGWYWATGG